jgi:SNF family Na+-dependent transporter
MLAVNGIPLFYMELAIGQYLSLGTVGAWTAICPMSRGKPHFHITRYCNVIESLSIQKDQLLSILHVYMLLLLYVGIGFAMMMLSFLVGIYYNVIIAWCVLFLFNSFRADVPWKECSNGWNTVFCR